MFGNTTTQDEVIESTQNKKQKRHKSKFIQTSEEWVDTQITRKTIHNNFNKFNKTSKDIGKSSQEIYECRVESFLNKF
tara:strand:- start:53 stop:286 length:234 start_codon:yes stop_codon:yes gene_type:complete